MSEVREPLPLGPALLFCPGHRPDRFAKAAARADAVILDLEDAVAPADKERARTSVAGHDLDPGRTVVRVNPPSTRDFEEDVAALAGTEVRYVMLPKAERPEDVDHLRAAVPGAGVVALCETASGVLAAAELARQPAVVALMWGGEDLLASLGGTSSRRPGGGYRDVVRHARSTVLLAARAHGRSVIDAVHTDLRDLETQRAQAEDAVASGFTATACLHPDQVAVVRAAYRPSAEQLDRARRVLAAAAAAGGGVFELDGHMVDEPILRHARLLANRSIHEETP